MRFPLVLVVSLLSGCVTAPPAPEVPSRAITPFSSNSPDLALPQGWKPWIINRVKSETVYDLVRDPVTGKVVLHAISDRSASGLRQLLDVDPALQPVIAWRWRIVDLVVVPTTRTGIRRTRRPA
jgi:hypothetical protein